MNDAPLCVSQQVSLLFMRKHSWTLSIAGAPYNHPQCSTTSRPKPLQRENRTPTLSVANPILGPEPTTRPFHLSVIPPSILFIFHWWIIVIYSQAWAFHGQSFQGGLWTRSRMLDTFLFPPGIISSDGGPSRWNASYVLVWHVVRLLDSVQRFWGGGALAILAFMGNCLHWPCPLYPLSVWFSGTVSFLSGIGSQWGSGASRILKWHLIESEVGKAGDNGLVGQLAHNSHVTQC